MNIKIFKYIVSIIFSVFLVLSSSLSFSDAPSSWSNIPNNAIKLFYPGQSSYQWLSSSKHKRANNQVKKGEACVSCHEGEEADMGEVMVSGEKLEPHPIKDEPAVINLNMKVAYDGTHVYFQFKWKTANPYPGSAHPHWQYDGSQWQQMGWPRLHKKVWQDGQPAIYEDRFSMMIDDGSVPYFAEQGCWLSCHDGMRDMPNLAKSADVKSHPILGKLLKKKDVRKYLPESRSDKEYSWNKLHSKEDIAQSKKDSAFTDLMQWRAHRSQPIGMADDGYVFEYRLTDAGKNLFSKNWDKSLKQPKYMFDKSKLDYKSRTLAQIRDLSQPSSLVVGENAVKFDGNANWKKGDMVPEYYLNQAMSKGSAADNKNVSAQWKDGYWTLQWQRKMDTGHPLDDKIMKVGSAYTFGLAIHDDNITTRGHHVSFPIKIGFGVKGDLEAIKVK